MSFPPMPTFLPARPAAPEWGRPRRNGAGRAGMGPAAPEWGRPAAPPAAPFRVPRSAALERPQNDLLLNNASGPDPRAC